MKKILLFFTKPVIGGALSLIGLLELLFRIPSSYFTYQISLWIVILTIGILIIISSLIKYLRILYFVKTYTSDSFGGSCQYQWRWIKTSSPISVFGFSPNRIDIMKPTKLNPQQTVIDCSHCINNLYLLREYIMIGLYNKVINTKQTKLFMYQLHEFEEHYSQFRN